MSKLIIIAVIILIILGALYFEFQRGSEMEKVAKDMGFVFHPGLQTIPEELEELEFDLFTQGPPNIKNRMEGSRDDRRVTILDFTYTSMSAAEGQRDYPVTDDHSGFEDRSQSVIWIESSATFPDFDLSPTGIHKRTVGARLGLSRLTFDGRNDFNERYVLLVRNAEQVRRLFSDELIAYLIKHPGLVFESRGKNSLFYRFEDRVDPKAIPGFLEDVLAVMKILESA